MFDFLMLYYLIVFVFAGIGGSMVAASDFNILSGSVLKLVFMYQYMLYMIAKDKLNMAGIIILEILLTLSVWFLNVFVFVIWCVWHILSAIWDLFYFVFKKR